MTRPKRTLAETDTNLDAVPAAKRASTDKENESRSSITFTGEINENIAPSTIPTGEANDNASIITCIRKTNQNPASTTLIRKVTGNTPSAAQRPKKITAVGKAALALQEPKNDQPSEDKQHSWVYICNPEEDTCYSTETCVCGKLADGNTTRQWVVTKKGYELATEWRIQRGKRDQDAFGMYIFNDWTGYGICEVMENMFWAFDKEMKKKKNRDALVLWSHIEGIALFLNDDIAEWHMLHDSEGNAKRTMLIGTALLETLRSFELDLSDIRNTGFVLAQLLTFAHTMSPSCRLNENGWIGKVMDMADQCHIAIDGIRGIAKVLDEIRETMPSEVSKEGEGRRCLWWLPRNPVVGDCDNLLLSYKGRPRSGGWITSASLAAGMVREWDDWTWMLEFEMYKQFQSVKVGPDSLPVYGGKIGGKFYDLTAQRNKGSHMRRFRLSEGAW